MKNLIFVSIIFITSLSSSFALTQEEQLITVFKKTKALKEKFLKNTLENRKEFEDFTENEFLPATKTMIKLLNANKCTSCTLEYLKALVYQKTSTTEDHTQNLQTLILKHPHSIKSACTALSSTEKKDLFDFFNHALIFLDETEKKPLNKTQKEFSSCF